jgi:hypothetical protein
MERMTNPQTDEALRVDEGGGSQSVGQMIRGHSRWWNERTARVRKWNTIPVRGKMLEATC